MFRIRRIYDDTIPSNRNAIDQVQAIWRRQFPGVDEDEIQALPNKLRDPLKHLMRSVLFVSEDSANKVTAFAIMAHVPDHHFCFLDYLAAPKGMTGRGNGGALYQRVREEARQLGATALYFECLTDAPGSYQDPTILRQNAARLRFYERFGARPVVGTKYETPLKPNAPPAPHLVIDTLEQPGALRRDIVRSAVRALLQRKYGSRCPPGYIETVVASFEDDPVRLRPFRYVRTPSPLPTHPTVHPDQRIALIVTDRHEIHHVRKRGYVESPARISSILDALGQLDVFQKHPPVHFGEQHITAVHDPEYVSYFKRVCSLLPANGSVYPYVFPLRNVAKPPKELAVRAGYYCIDTFTPLNGEAFSAAKRAVDCVLTGAKLLTDGRRLAYALVRPPGHHAERRSFGGFCYFNSAACAAHFLSRTGRVAILDLDYHHGNGQQEIFYARRDVLTLSIHGHPRFAYPYFSGFSDERGTGEGEGFNVNLPLPEDCDGAAYRVALTACLHRIRRFSPAFLLVALGLDTARKDPTGTWSLQAADFEENGSLVGGLHLPTLVIQEGGYDTHVLGRNARSFMIGLWHGAFRTGIR